YYLWGSFEELPPAEALGGIVAPDDMRVRIELVIWNGFDRATRLTEEVQTPELDAAIARLVEQLEAQVTRPRPDRVALKARDEAVRLLAERVLHLRRAFGQKAQNDPTFAASDWGRAMQAVGRQLGDAALFLGADSPQAWDR